MDEIIDEIIDEICNAIAEMAVEAAIDAMHSLVVNEGQETLVGDIEGDVEDQVEGISNGEYEAVDTDHPEAIGEIVDGVNNFLDDIAGMCEQIREAADAIEMFF